VHVRLSAVEEPDHRHRRLLRARRERPRGCHNPKQRDEIATPHGGLPQGQGSRAKYSRSWSGFRAAHHSKSGPLVGIVDQPFLDEATLVLAERDDLGLAVVGHRAASGSSRSRVRRHHGSSAPTRSSTSVLVGTLAVKKPLFLNVRCERLLGTLLGKKPCVINEQVDSERISPFVCFQRLSSVSPALTALLAHNGF